MREQIFKEKLLDKYLRWQSLIKGVNKHAKWFCIMNHLYKNGRVVV